MYSNDGWAHFFARKPTSFRSVFVTEWDNWDKILLRNSRSAIKKLFKSYYYSRDFRPGDELRDDPARALRDQLKALFTPSPGQWLLPWWKKGRIRSNPFDANGNLCEKKDS